MPDNDERRPVIRGSGDAFLDLGIELTPEERVKIAIAREITRVIVAKNYTQSQAAKIIGADQPKISKISRGLVDEFTADRLIGFLLLLGVDLNITTSESRERTGRVTINAPMEAVG